MLSQQQKRQQQQQQRRPQMSLAKNMTSSITTNSCWVAVVLCCCCVFVFLGGGVLSIQPVEAFTPTISATTRSFKTQHIVISTPTFDIKTVTTALNAETAEEDMVDTITSSAASSASASTTASESASAPPTPMQLEIAPQTMPVAKPAVSNVIDTSIPPLSNPSTPSMETIALVAGQENYGLAIVLLAEGIWSFVKAPSFDHALKTLVPSTIAAVVLVAVSGPAITSGSPDQVSTGLAVATAVSVGMGGVYVARLAAPYSPSPKEIPALGLLVAVAGLFSFGQNLIVDGFVTLPSIPLPSLPTIELPF
eukprot:CAMPEP_0113447660 /NCGR_PEP_ID=MMETSP0014_2-20120614/4354_1 /TAXON_ID=2857 /ORGANISM="Nitzschia sp." /LENGTH=307 /DNA_ID=CAMNT_0000338825 /DNA_START=366 /DNA_END=1289 /DNA_ORIENTATION=+ /assembly_acc=CAM_ASM_000159